MKKSLLATILSLSAMCLCADGTAERKTGLSRSLFGFEWGELVSVEYLDLSQKSDLDDSVVVPLRRPFRTFQSVRLYYTPISHKLYKISMSDKTPKDMTEEETRQIEELFVERFGLKFHGKDPLYTNSDGVFIEIEPHWYFGGVDIRATHRKLEMQHNKEVQRIKSKLRVLVSDLAKNPEQNTEEDSAQSRAKDLDAL